MEAFDSPSAHPALPSLVRGLTWLVEWENSEEIFLAWGGIKRHHGTTPVSIWECEIALYENLVLQIERDEGIKDALLTSISVFHNNFISSKRLHCLRYHWVHLRNHLYWQLHWDFRQRLEDVASKQLIGYVWLCDALSDLKCRVFFPELPPTHLRPTPDDSVKGLQRFTWVKVGNDDVDHTSQAFGDVPRAAMNMGSWPILSWHGLHPNELINFWHAWAAPSPWHSPYLQSEVIPGKCHKFCPQLLQSQAISCALKDLTSKIPALIALVPYGFWTWWISSHKERWLWPELPNNAAQCKGVLPSILFSCQNT